MKTLAMIALSTALTGCALFKSGPAVPPPIAGEWRACGGNVEELGLKNGALIKIQPEIIGRDQFDLRIGSEKNCDNSLKTVTFHDGEPINAKTLEKSTLLLTQPTHTHSKFGNCSPTDNVLKKDQADDLLAYTGMFFLTRFDNLVRERRIHTFVSGVGYLNEHNDPDKSKTDEKDKIDEPHLIISFGYMQEEDCTNSEAQKHYVLSVTSFGGALKFGMHNGVVHGKP